jgi:hypothetical protein
MIQFTQASSPRGTASGDGAQSWVRQQENLLMGLAIVIAAVGAFVIGASVVENGWLL